MEEKKAVETEEVVSVSLARTPPPAQKIILADGIEYELTILNLNMLGEIEETLNIPLAELGELLKTPGKVPIKVIRKIIWLSLCEKCPEMTEDGFGKLVTAEIIINGSLQKAMEYIFSIGEKKV